MKESNMDWVKQLRQPPVTGGIFTADLWDGVESKLQSDGILNKLRLKSMITAGCVVLALTGVLYFLPKNSLLHISIGASQVFGMTNNDPYSAIDLDYIKAIADNENLDFIHVFKGHDANWVAIYVVYKLKEDNSYSADQLIKYIGKEPGPNGMLNYEFQTAGGVYSSSSTAAYLDFKTNIFNSLITPGKDSTHILNSDGSEYEKQEIGSKVHFRISWNQGESEEFDLKLDT